MADLILIKSPVEEFSNTDKKYICYPPTMGKNYTHDDQFQKIGSLTSVELFDRKGTKKTRGTIFFKSSDVKPQMCHIIFIFIWYNTSFVIQNRPNTVFRRIESHQPIFTNTMSSKDDPKVRYINFYIVSCTYLDYCFIKDCKFIEEVTTKC